MSDKIRELSKKCDVGKYSFTLIVNRNIVFEGFKKHPKLFKIISEQSKKRAGGEFDTNDIEALFELMETNSALLEEIPEFVADILPDMLKAGGSDVDAEEFVNYCVKNEIDDIVNDELFNFAMLGFTEGRSVKKPKVKVKFS